MLPASGRFAMLDDGMGFSLIPWKSMIERRLGQSVSAVLCRKCPGGSRRGPAH
ncbi:DUF3363 domain-containing protein [Rhodanobacter denitrificans]|uniref:DUF3363 domain-containing protein n=1 Tax=Rhodanobacter denitrificans TaxID=666685 RepID=UPI003CCD9C5D